MKISRKHWVLGVSLVVAIALAALAVWASPVRVMGGSETFEPNRTHFVWSSSDQQTDSKDYKKVRLGSAVTKHYGPLVARYTLKVSGNAPVQFKVPENNFKPSKVVFDPSASRGTDTFSFTAVLQKNDWTCSDPRLKWRSPTGEPVRLRFTNVVIDYKVKNVQPDFACR